MYHYRLRASPRVSLLPPNPRFAERKTHKTLTKQPRVSPLQFLFRFSTSPLWRTTVALACSLSTPAFVATVIIINDFDFNEYGHEGLVSTSCDVYSFGILLMEVFCRKKPIDEMFTSDLSLKHWVSEALHNDVIRVIDSSLVRKEDEQFTAKVSCVSSIFELALNCSAEAPEKRINIKDALALLMKIRLKFLANLSEN